MSGLMFAGMALGGIHIANAQNNVNPEIDNSRYTVMIPSCFRETKRYVKKLSVTFTKISCF